MSTTVELVNTNETSENIENVATTTNVATDTDVEVENDVAAAPNIDSIETVVSADEIAKDNLININEDEIVIDDEPSLPVISSVIQLPATSTDTTHVTHVTDDGLHSNVTSDVAEQMISDKKQSNDISNAEYDKPLEIGLESKMKTVPSTDKPPEPIATEGTTNPDTKISDECLGATAATSEANSDVMESVYNVKWIKFNNASLPIVTQNENGPCPLLAIMNYLFLQQSVHLPQSTEIVTSSKLISYLADYIFEHVPKHIQPDTRLNYEQKMHDAMAMFPKLQTGLDVNVRFTGVTHFEYTPSCEIFDLLNIPLYHGWLVDPESKAVVEAVSNATYNQLVEMVINQKSSSQDDLVHQALLAEEFLNSTASQMTYHGLCELAMTLNDSQMGVLFRNNHFHTLLKHNDALYVLATDQGFLNEPQVVWETLTNIEGDSHFCDANYRIFQSNAPLLNLKQSDVSVTNFASSAEQIDHDYLVALSMEQEQTETSQTTSQWADLGLSDEELAKKLQEEENSYVNPTESKANSKHPHQHPQQQPHTASATATNREITSRAAGQSSRAATTGAKAKKDSLCDIM